MIPNWLCCRKEVSAGAKLCYARLLQHAGNEDHAYPKQAVLAGELGVTDRQVRDYLKELETHRLIRAEKGGRGQASVYFFLLHEWAEGVDDRNDSSAQEDRKCSSAVADDRNNGSAQGLVDRNSAAAQSELDRKQSSAEKGVDRNNRSALTGSIVPVTPCKRSKEEIHAAAAANGTHSENGKGGISAAQAAAAAASGQYALYLGYVSRLSQGDKQSIRDLYEWVVLSGIGLPSDEQVQQAVTAALESYQGKGFRSPPASIKPVLDALKAILEGRELGAGNAADHRAGSGGSGSGKQARIQALADRYRRERHGVGG